MDLVCEIKRINSIKNKKWLHFKNRKCNHLKIFDTKKRQHCKETVQPSGCIVSFVE